MRTGGFPWRSSRCVHCGRLAVSSNSNGAVCAEHIKSDRLTSAPWEQRRLTRIDNVIQEYKRRFGTPAAIELHKQFPDTDKLLDEMERQIKAQKDKPQ